MSNPLRESTDTPIITIIILEPEVLARIAVAEYLRGCGYRVIECLQAEEVFTVLSAGTQVDIVFTDVSLGGDLLGLQMAKQIREKYPAIDVILTRGISDAADRAGQLCDEGPVEKPFHPQELVKRIQLLREKRRTAFPAQ